MTRNILAYPSDAQISSAPFRDVVPLTPGPDELADGPCRGLWVETAGKVNITTLAGIDRDNVPVFQGVNPIGITKLRGLSGGAAGVWAGY